MHIRIYCLLAILFIFSLHSRAQTKDLVVAQEITFFSRILHETRSVLIYLPAGYDKAKFYPVVYVLDGEIHTVYTGATVATLTAASVVPEMIVVGILNNNRTRDLTPTHFTKDLHGKENINQQVSGGGDKFIDFIGMELIKYVDSAYSTLPFRVGIGHSLGGLLVTHALFTEKKIFSGYIAIDPSLHWDNYYLLDRVKNNPFLKPGRQILYTASSIKPANPNDSLTNGVGIAALEMILKEKRIAGLQYTFENFENESHGTIPIPGIARGLQYIFKDYFFPGLFIDSTDKVVGKILRHYDNFSKVNGGIFLPPEAMINDLGYHFLYELKKYDQAVKVFKMNVINYPGSSNSFDSLGEAYLFKGDTLNAVKNYQKAIRLNPGSLNAADVLKRIQVQK